MIGIVAPFAPGKTFVLEIPGVNVFVGVGNDFPAALPHASPRLKILMVPHCYCRVTPRAGYSGNQYHGKTLVLLKLGVKVQRGLGEVQNEHLGPKRRLAPGLPILEA